MSDSNSHSLSENFMCSFDAFQPISSFYTSILNIIKSLEVRSRFNPFAVNNEKTHLLLFNSFQCFWLYFKNHKEAIKHESPFQNLVYLSLGSLNPHEEFDSILQSVWDNLHDPCENYHLFLRQSLIFKSHCLSACLVQYPESFYDTEDPVRGYNDLCSALRLRAKGHLVSNVVGSFSFLLLPPVFVDLYRDHYQLLSATERVYVYAIPAGRIMRLEDVGGALTLLLVLSGREIGLCFLSYRGQRARVPSVYLTAFAEEGAASGEMLYLAEDRLAKAADALLSGEALLTYG